MRKIQFNEDTINEIKDFIAQGHTNGEVCNRFNIKYDTLRRVMFENNIAPYKQRNCKHIELTPEIESEICSLFEESLIRIEDICSEVKLPNYMVQDVLRRNFTKEQIDKRHAKFYRESKLGLKNPMTNRTYEQHHNYKGIIDDGNGYLMCLKPDWFTGRKNKTYVFVHHIEFCLATGLTEIPKGFVIHHIDLNKKNNDPSNLAMMSMAAHARLHAMLKRMSKVQRLSHTGVGESPNAEQ